MIPQALRTRKTWPPQPADVPERLDGLAVLLKRLGHPPQLNLAHVISRRWAEPTVHRQQSTDTRYKLRFQTTTTRRMPFRRLSISEYVLCHRNSYATIARRFFMCELPVLPVPGTVVAGTVHRLGYSWSFLFPRLHSKQSVCKLLTSVLPL
jgi:hypothetical protein